MEVPVGHGNCELYQNHWVQCYLKLIRRSRVDIHLRKIKAIGQKHPWQPWYSEYGSPEAYYFRFRVPSMIKKSVVNLTTLQKPSKHNSDCEPFSTFAFHSLILSEIPNGEVINYVRYFQSQNNNPMVILESPMKSINQLTFNTSMYWS